MSDAKSPSGKKKSSPSGSKKADAPSKPASIILSHRPIMTAPTFADQPLSQGDAAPPTAPKLGVTREPQLKPLSAPIPADIVDEKADEPEPEEKTTAKDDEKAEKEDSVVEKAPDEKEETSDAPAGELKLAAAGSEDKPDDEDAKEPESEKEEEAPAQPDEKEDKDDAEKPDEPAKVEKADDAPAVPGDNPDGDGKSQPELSNKEKLEQEAAEREAKHDTEIEKMVESKKYFLPINAIEKRRTKRFILLGIVVSVILAVAWVDVALDAGLIHIAGVKPFTHFFSN